MASKKHIAELVKMATGGHFYLWNMAGPHNAGIRQQIMRELTGSKLPRAQCGINALMKSLNTLFDAGGDCQAVREDTLVERLKVAILADDRWDAARVRDLLPRVSVKLTDGEIVANCRIGGRDLQFAGVSLPTGGSMEASWDALAYCLNHDRPLVV